MENKIYQFSSRLFLDCCCKNATIMKEKGNTVWSRSRIQVTSFIFELEERRRAKQQQAARSQNTDYQSLYLYLTATITEQQTSEVSVAQLLYIATRRY